MEKDVPKNDKQGGNGTKGKGKPAARRVSDLSCERPIEREEDLCPGEIRPFDVFLSYALTEMRSQAMWKHLSPAMLHEVITQMWEEMMDEEKMLYINAAKTLNRRQREKAEEEKNKGKPAVKDGGARIQMNELVYKGVGMEKVVAKDGDDKKKRKMSDLVSKDDGKEKKKAKKN